MKCLTKAIGKCKNRIYKILQCIGYYLKALRNIFFCILFRIFKIDNNKILIVSYYGKGYGDNGKYLVNEFLKSNKCYKIYWATKEAYRDSLPKSVRYVKYNSIGYMYHLVTAKIWINNSRFALGTKKRKKQIYYQTWHSSLRLKKIEKDVEDMLPKRYVQSSKFDSRMISIMSAGSDFSYRTYSDAFWYDGKILKLGTPRCDLFFDNDAKMKLKNQILEKYNISNNKKIILYAPTFRKDSSNESNMDFEMVERRINAKNSESEYVVLVRFHPVSKVTYVSKSNVINVTDYPDMQELICISDFLITDFSGCCFDMMINKKPCILFIKDKENYINNERKLYFNIDELPFPKVYSEDELIKYISDFDEQKYFNDVEKFCKKINLYERGTASRDIVKYIEKIGGI